MRKTFVFFNLSGMLLLFVGIGAIAAGVGFIQKPDGKSLGMTVDLLENSPFTDFLIPGIVLFTVNGLGSLFGAYLCFKHKKMAGAFTSILGIVMIIWISAQAYWIGLQSWLQPTFFIVGILEIIFGLMIKRKK